MKRMLHWALALLFLLSNSVEAGDHLRFGHRGGGAAPNNNGVVTQLTLVSSAGSTQTNVPVMIGLPLSAGVLTSSNHIQVLDSDGVTVVPVQEDNRASDLGGNVRFVGLTIVQPTIAAGQTRTLTVSTVSGAPATGTDVAVSDILATAYDYQVSIADHNGSTYTCSPRTGLSAGAYTNTTTAANQGTWRSGGGLVTEYIVMAPATSGGTSHPNLRCMFHVAAFKAQTGPVSGGNPIIAIRTERIIESGWVSHGGTTSTDDWYGLSETSGTFSQSFPNATPAITLTLGTNTAKTPSALTAASAIFTPSSIGNYLTDGTGVAVVTGYTSPTSAEVMVFKAFSSTTITSGTYTLYGIAQLYGSRYRQENWWSGATVPKVAANLGPAWNGTTLTGGPLSYIEGTRLIPNYASTPATVNTENPGPGFGLHGLVRLAAEPNPVGYISNSYQNGFAGDITMYIGQTGERAEISTIPDWYVAGLIEYDNTSMPQFLGEADKSQLAPMNWRDPATGKSLSLSNGIDYYLAQDPAHPYGALWISMSDFNPAVPSIDNWNLQVAHFGQYHYLPYMLTGDFYWLESLQFSDEFLWLANNPGYHGSQLNRTMFADQEMRGSAWALRTIGETYLMTPDVNKAPVSYPKSMMLNWLTNQWTATNSGVAGTAPYPGAMISFVNNTGGSGRYATVGMRWTHTGGDADQASQWMAGYMTFVLFHLKDLGVLDSNGLAFLNWFGEGISSAPLITSGRPEYITTSYWIDVIYPNGTNLSAWSDIYKASASDPVSNMRQLSGTMTLSATSGTAIQATMPPGNFGGGSWYVGQWVYSKDGGYAAITAVNGDTLTLDTTQSMTRYLTVYNGHAFGSTTETGGNYFVPWPAPGDPLGSEMVSYFASPSNDYYNDAWAVNILLTQDGYPNEPAALNAVMSWSSAGWSQGSEVKWHVAPRQ